jgi:hypothetical protein
MHWNLNTHLSQLKANKVTDTIKYTLSDCHTLFLTDSFYNIPDPLQDTRMWELGMQHAAVSLLY